MTENFVASALEQQWSGTAGDSPVRGVSPTNSPNKLESLTGGIAGTTGGTGPSDTGGDYFQIAGKQLVGVYLTIWAQVCGPCHHQLQCMGSDWNGPGWRKDVKLLLPMVAEKAFTLYQGRAGGRHLYWFRRLPREQGGCSHQDVCI